jgi:hypothetical protein
VQPLIESRNSADETSTKLPVIRNVPVKFPRAGKFRITFPVDKGDTVHLEFCERSIATWLASGAPSGSVDPGDIRRFALSDAVACLGLYDSKHALQNQPPSGAMSIGEDGGCEIKIDGNDVTVNGGSANVGRVGDAVDAGSLSGTVMVAGAAVAVQFTYIPAGAGSPVGPGPTAALNSGQISAGAAHFKA